MSGSLTVIGGHSAGFGLVNVPLDQTSVSLTSLLQGDLDSIGAAVTTAGAASFTNYDVTGGGFVDSVVGTDPSLGLYEITNTDTTGATTSGSVAISSTVPAGYSTLVVQAPGTETITGNGSTNFLAIFSSNSTVNFTAVGDGNVSSGTGTVVASTNNFIDVGGTYANGAGWSILGGATGGDTINTTAENTSIVTQGTKNLIGLGGIFATVVAGGNGDLIGGFGGLNTITVTGAGSNAIIMGGSDTITAAAGSSSFDAFFSGNGGKLDFINNSSVGAAITGSFAGASGSLTVNGGIGGGYYEGGAGGNNSLVGSTLGGAGATLVGAGNNNFLSVNGSGANALFASASTLPGGGAVTLVAGANTDNNLLEGGTGTDSIVSFGTGNQDFFVGNTGAETLTGSSVTGSLNTYYFQEGSVNGGGLDVITDFRYGTDHGFINPYSTDSVYGNTAISSVTNGGGFTQVDLSDGTTIKLLGVNLTAQESASLVGGNSF